MTAIDDRLIPKVEALIARLGKSIVINCVTNEGTVSNDGSVKGRTETPVTVKVIPPYPVDDKYVNGDTTRMGDLQTYVPAVSFGYEPVAGWTAVIDNKTWTIVSVEPIYTGDAIALYGLVMRK